MGANRRVEGLRSLPCSRLVNTVTGPCEALRAQHSACSEPANQCRSSRAGAEVLEVQREGITALLRPTVTLAVSKHKDAAKSPKYTKHSFLLGEVWIATEHPVLQIKLR